ncbi:TonB-dependent receptor [Nitrospirillum iridis]|uniref:Iron complex outermembrane receptor protein n=1 Tax=Nitrospirillum iridis TaxID=765888 RepID=A0A7X0EFR6_9PROT|nr:TonB-dependent receptor [Nitrospirillum iridis]MBB6253321.1 iron complex outermembrane receptor protein [Nitrospirillum iridis]
MTKCKPMLVAWALSAAAFWAVLPASAPAHAEGVPQPDAASPATAPDVEEIIVTARKRQESILKVPVVETALTEATLDRAQAVDLRSIAAHVPGLVMGAGTLSVGNQVSIRGVGTTSLDAGVDQSVSLNIDGLQLTQGLAYKVGLFDLAQAEVLKGPQSLFFGKNSPGGVISLRSADPGDRVELIARSGYEAEAREWRNEVIVSGPLTDTLGIRLAGMYDTTDGYFDNHGAAVPGLGGAATDGRFAAARNYILRGTAVWKPSEVFDARLKVNIAHDRVADGGIQQMASCPDGVAGPNGIPFINPKDDCRLNRDMWVVNSDPAAFPGIRNSGVSFSDQGQKFGTLEMNVNLTDALALTSVSGYYHLRQDSLINGTATGAAGAALDADNHFTREDFTEELRLSSDFSGPINFTAGGFYQNGQMSNRIWVMGNTKLGLPATLQLGSHHVDIESASAFGQLRWRPIDQVEVSGGVRFTDERRSDREINAITGTDVVVPLAKPNIGSDNFSPEFTVSYMPTDDLTVFGSLKRGYKSGSFSITTITAAGSDNSFGDEKVDGGEVGLKSRWLDRSLSLNLAGYYYSYKGLQVGANEPPQGGTGPIVLRTINAGAAEVYGIDFDVNYQPPSVAGLTLRGSVNWNHARFTALDKVPCWGGQTIAQGCNEVMDPATGRYTSQNLDGKPLVRAPDWQASVGFDYTMPVWEGKNLTFSTSGQYSSRYLTNLLARDDFYQAAFFKTDASVTLSGVGGRWEVALIGNNLTDKITTGNCTNGNFAYGQILGGQLTGSNAVGPAGTDELLCFADRGRELWTRLTVKFN